MRRLGRRQGQCRREGEERGSDMKISYAGQNFVTGRAEIGLPWVSAGRILRTS